MRKIYNVLNGVIKEYILIKETEKTFEVTVEDKSWFKTRVRKFRSAYPIECSEHSTLDANEAIELAEQQIAIIDKKIEKQYQRLIHKELALEELKEKYNET